MKKEEVLGYFVAIMIVVVILLAIFLPRGGGGDPIDTVASHDRAKQAYVEFRQSGPVEAENIPVAETTTATNTVADTNLTTVVGHGVRSQFAE